MPLHGKIVVIKRSGGDGTEFPLTATCLFGRKPDCDIRIQLPQVSKEHCRIDLNENKEIILTNLSSVNPTRINGEALQQSERLKHGDVITVIDRSFRFEYPPAPTRKKRSSLGAKTETFKVLQNQQVGDTAPTETGEKGTSEVSTDPHLKDGTNHENIQRPLEKTVETKEEDGLLQSKTASPFNDLYQMIKKSLDVKTPRKSSVSVLQTPTSRFCTPKPGLVRKNEDEKQVIYTEEKISPKKDEANVSFIADKTEEEAGNVSNETPKSVKKQPFQVPSTEMVGPKVDDAENADCSEETPQKRSRTPPQRFTACEVVKQISPSPKSPVRRTSPRNSGKVETGKKTSKKRKSEELASDLPTSQMKRKRVSFGGALCPELFDKRLPPDSPLCKGAMPRRSLCVSKPKRSLLRRASVMGLLQDKEEHSVSPKRRISSPKSRSLSPKPATPAKKIPKSKSSPTVQGRFSVSHISTPEDAVTEQEALVTATPKIPLRRKSILRGTPSHAKLLCKRSGISRASMKVKNSWADIVRFGKTRAQVAAPVKKTVAKKTTLKKTVSRPQTPARNLKGHVSTGHADSPLTIVVGRAHKQRVVHSTGAAPKLVTNVALFKKHMKMDEDLTGISEMLKTPGNERRKTSVIDENNAPKALVGSLCSSVVEPSVLNTPEEPGEMMVSPLTVSSTVKDRSYNSEAVQRLFDNDQESSIIIDAGVLGDSSEQRSTDLKTTSVATPKLKPELPDCLTGVKRIMKTPKQKAEPIEDLKGRILKTPKQKPEEQECLTGVKRMMTTPKQEAEPVEDINVELLTTLTQTPEQQECPTEVERICKTALAEPLEDQGKPLEAPTAETNEAADQVPLDCDEDIAKELVFSHEEPRDNAPTDVVPVPQVEMQTEAGANEVVVDDYDNQPSDAVEISPAAVDEKLSEDQPEMDTVDEKLSEDQPEMDTVDEKLSEDQPEMDTVDEKLSEDQPQVDTVDEKLSEDQPEMDTVDEKLSEDQPQVDTVDEKLSEDQPQVEAAAIKVTEMDTMVTVESLVAEAAEDFNKAVVPTPVRGRRGKKTEATAPPAVRRTTRGRHAESQGPSDDQPEMAPEKALQTALVTKSSTDAVSDQTSQITANDCEPTEEEAVAKPTRGRKSKHTPVQPPQPEPELNEVGAESLPEDVQHQKSIPALENPRRGRKPKPDVGEQNVVVEDAVVAVETKRQSQAPVRAKRGRNAKQEEEKLESSSVETTKSREPSKKVKRTTKAEQDKSSEDKAEVMPEPESQQSPPVGVNHEARDSAAPLKLKRGRKAKQSEKSVTEQQEAPSSQADLTKEADESEVCNVAHSRSDGKKSDDMTTARQAPVTESLPEVETETRKVTEMDAVVQKKYGRGRRVKQVESNSVEDKRETAEDCGEAVVPTLVRGRRGKKTEATAPPAENDSTLTVEAVVKPTRGRKSKQMPVEPPQPELNEIVSEESYPADAHPPNPRRGKKPKPDVGEQNVVVEDAVVTVETKQKSQAPVRAKRGRNAKQEEEKLESASVEKSREPAKKVRTTKAAQDKSSEDKAEVMPEPESQQSPPVGVNHEARDIAALLKPKRGRKAKQSEDHGEPKEVKAIELVVPEEADAPIVSESVKLEEQVVKPRRGGRKATEVQEVPAAGSTERLQKKNAEPDAPVVKQSRARGAKSTVSQAIPAKKARRGAAFPLEETNAESTVQVPEPAATSVEPAKRGKRAAAKPPASSVPAKPTEDSSKAVEDSKMSKRSVKWKADFEETPVKAVRGRKSKLEGQVDTKSKTEEMDLSDEAVEAPPVKRTRKGPKVAEEAVSTSKGENLEADAQPKTRRGREAKK